MVDGNPLLAVLRIPDDRQTVLFNQDAGFGCRIQSEYLLRANVIARSRQAKYEAARKQSLAVSCGAVLRIYEYVSERRRCITNISTLLECIEQLADQPIDRSYVIVVQRASVAIEWNWLGVY